MQVKNKEALVDLEHKLITKDKRGKFSQNQIKSWKELLTHDEFSAEIDKLEFESRNGKNEEVSPTRANVQNRNTQGRTSPSRNYQQRNSPTRI